MIIRFLTFTIAKVAAYSMLILAATGYVAWFTTMDWRLFLRILLVLAFIISTYNFIKDEFNQEPQ